MAKMKKLFTEEQVRQLDLRRQRQIANQSDSITRLLEEGATYDSEMKLLHEKLAAAEQERDAALQELKKLDTPYTLGK